jgi:rod shape-determining protein MreC
MAVYRRAARPRFMLVFLVLTSITLVTLDVRGGGSGLASSLRGTARDAFAPVQNAVSGAISPITDFFGGVFEYRSLKNQNALLREQLDQRNTDQAAALGAQRELKDLLDLEHLDYVGDIPTVAARVVAGPESNFQLTLTLNRGSDNGLIKGMPVVAAGGLVGRLTDVSKKQSTVLVVSDPSFSVGVRLSPAGDVGVASGQGADRPLTVDLVNTGIALNPGDVLVTAGLRQSPYPPGIPVGRVKTAATSPGSQRQSVVVEPLIDLGRLSYVKVLIWTPK